MEPRILPVTCWALMPAAAKKIIPTVEIKALQYRREQSSLTPSGLILISPIAAVKILEAHPARRRRLNISTSHRCKEIFRNAIIAGRDDVFTDNVIGMMGGSPVNFVGLDGPDSLDWLDVLDFS